MSKKKKSYWNSIALRNLFGWYPVKKNYSLSQLNFGLDNKSCVQLNYFGWFNKILVEKPKIWLRDNSRIPNKAPLAKYRIKDSLVLKS